MTPAVSWPSRPAASSVAFVVSLLGLGPPSVPDSWDEAERLLRFHSLEGLAWARDREVDRAFLPESLRARLETVYRTQALETTLVLESAERARDALGRAGVDSLLFKGAALVADGTYGDPGARRMDDADVLVRTDEAERAVDALVGAGFRPVTGWSPDRTAWLDALTLHDGAAPEGATVAIDLHWRTDYDRLRFGGAASSFLWRGADLVTGRPRTEEHLVLVAEHLLKHLRFKVHLTGWGDLARLAGQVADWNRVEALAARSRLERGIRALTAVLDAELGAGVPARLRAGATPALVRLLAPSSLVGRVRPVEGRLAGIVHRWRLLGTPGRVAADAADAAFPSGAWLRGRYGRGGVVGWGRYVADVLRWVVYRGRSPASPNQELFDPRARE